MMFPRVSTSNDYVSETVEEGGDVLQLRRQLHAGVREDTPVVGQYEEVQEFPESSSDSKANPGVLQYRTGNNLFGQYAHLYLVEIFFKNE